MSAEIQNDMLIDIYNNAISFMKSKDIQSFSESYFRILESEDVDLYELLDITDFSDDDNEFHKQLEAYLDSGEEKYDEDEEDF